MDTVYSKEYDLLDKRLTSLLEFSFQNYRDTIEATERILHKKTFIALMASVKINSKVFDIFEDFKNLIDIKFSEYDLFKKLSPQRSK